MILNIIDEKSLTILMIKIKILVKLELTLRARGIEQFRFLDKKQSRLNFSKVIANGSNFFLYGTQSRHYNSTVLFVIPGHS